LQQHNIYNPLKRLSVLYSHSIYCLKEPRYLPVYDTVLEDIWRGIGHQRTKSRFNDAFLLRVWFLSYLNWIWYTASRKIGRYECIVCKEVAKSRFNSNRVPPEYIQRASQLLALNSFRFDDVAKY
jgi:hypothetical protein